MSPPTRWGREHFLHDQPGPVVVVTARVAAWLDARGLSALRVNARGVDAEVDAVLAALHYAALSWRTSLTSAQPEVEPEVAGPDVGDAPGLAWVSSTQAADLLGITDRAVRLAMESGRLPAEKVDGRWRVAREDLEHFRAGRRAA
ncbi:MAG: helix-turn-helix domain-containing protein [Actinomycetota bacterium]|nr:helix-turn-helix domain-containing protein [Actinomycetota bacterium]